MVLGTSAERVARGIAECDRVFGEDWPSKISVESLDLMDCCDCVLGQIAGYYSAGLQSLGVDVDIVSEDYDEWQTSEETFGWAVNHGFNVPDDATDEDVEEIAEIWKKEIRKRQGEGDV